MTRWTQQWMRSGWTSALAACLSLGLATLLAPPTQANTPDGEPPAAESVCDDITDDAAGGLCIAYCEAMDCGNENQKASDTACEQVADRYEAVAGEPPPCIPVECPCISTWTNATGAPDITQHTFADPQIRASGMVCGDGPVAIGNPSWGFVTTFGQFCADSVAPAPADVLNYQFSDDEVAACIAELARLCQ